MNRLDQVPVPSAYDLISSDSPFSEAGYGIPLTTDFGDPSEDTALSGDD